MDPTAATRRRQIVSATVDLLLTEWYGQAAIYCITATTRENCLALTESHQPQPIGRWELPERVTGDHEAVYDDEELA